MPASSRWPLLVLLFGLVVQVSCSDTGTKSELRPPDAVYADPDDPRMRETAPDSFGVVFETSRGEFVVEVRREWAPIGVDRFYNLVRSGYYDQCRFFRVVERFVAQWGIHGDPGVNALWRHETVPDDPVVLSNLRGTLAYAKTGEPNSRTTQLYLNLDDNPFLDGEGFAPFARVTSGMQVADLLYGGYGSAGPDQGRLLAEGNAYLLRDFPRLDYILRATVRP
jgi:peptidyl-prolyl cis-trans isomerase A (cyclophilin A)